MDYTSEPNWLLEALAYLGRRATGHTWARMEQNLYTRGIAKTPVFEETLRTLTAVTDQLDRAVQIPEAHQPLFGNLEGFPDNAIGSASVAFILFYPLVWQYNGDAASLADVLEELTPDQVAYGIVSALDLSDDLDTTGSYSAPQLVPLVLSLQVPDASKVAILDAVRLYRDRMHTILPYLQAAAEILQAAAGVLRPLAERFGRRLEAAGYQEFFRTTSHLAVSKDGHYHLHPFLFGPDTNLSAPALPDGATPFYCGILRPDLLEMLSAKEDVGDDVFEAFRLLGDRTRFDILCYLRTRRAYGQELSTYFSLSRNTIHHHMNKLLKSGLVSCTVEGNRVYYTICAEAVDRLLQRQRALLLP